MPDNLGISIVLLAAAWTSISQYLTALKILQYRKDLVLDIEEKGKCISALHKSFIMKNDFIPLWAGSFSFLLLMFFMILLGPYISMKKQISLIPLEIVLLYVIAFVVFAISLTVLCCGIRDIRQMRKYIASLPKNTC